MDVKNITVEQLIEKTNLSRMTVFNVRRGLGVTLLTALKISEALEVPVEEIWTLEESETEGSSVANVSA